MNDINQNMYRVDPNVIYQKRQRFLGMASFIISLVALILMIICIALMFIGAFFSIVLYYPTNILTILGIVLGAISYFGPFKVIYGLAAFIIGIVILSIAPILISLSSYIFSSMMMSSMMGGLL